MARLMEDTSQFAYAGSRFVGYRPEELLAAKSYRPMAGITPARVSTQQIIEKAIREKRTQPGTATVRRVKVKPPKSRAQERREDTLGVDLQQQLNMLVLLFFMMWMRMRR